MKICTGNIFMGGLPGKKVFSRKNYLANTPKKSCIRSCTFWW